MLLLDDPQAASAAAQVIAASAIGGRCHAGLGSILTRRRRRLKPVGVGMPRF
jgi:hypothetical protein